MSSRQIERIFPESEAPIYLYEDLLKPENQQKSLQELLGTRGMILLYQRSGVDAVGHWTAVVRTSKGIEFFDPLGRVNSKEMIPDEELKCEDFEHFQPILRQKFLEDPSKHEFNEVPLQQNSSEVSTCGYWVCLRLLMNQMTLSEFRKWVMHTSQGLGFTKYQFVYMTIKEIIQE